MQLDDTKKHTLRNAFEVAADDNKGLTEAIASFNKKRCVVCVSIEDVLIQHIRVEMDVDEQQLIERLQTHDVEWGNAEIRTVCIKTTGSGVDMKQELLCVGINRVIMQEVVNKFETSGAKVELVTAPIHASIRAFDKLYRRDGDDKITSMLIDMDVTSSIVTISHGANCVFAHQIVFGSTGQTPTLITQEPTLIPLSSQQADEFDRRNQNEPRGLHGIQEVDEEIESKLANELERCLRHHDALFPHRAIDRIIFMGSGADYTERCEAIASSIGISGYISEPSAWISGATDYTNGPAWTTVTGLCLRSLEAAA
jgi:Tfp pilus assembly PilM family ATPase